MFKSILARLFTFVLKATIKSLAAEVDKADDKVACMHKDCEHKVKKADQVYKDTLAKAEEARQKATKLREEGRTKREAVRHRKAEASKMLEKLKPLAGS